METIKRLLRGARREYFASVAGELCLKSAAEKKYLAPAESGLKSAAAVNSARLALRYAFFAQFHEVSYPPKQGPGSELEPALIPRTLPQMSAERCALLGETRDAKFKGKSVKL